MFSRLIITLKKKKNFQLWFVFEKEKHATLKWQPKLSQQRRSQFFINSRLEPFPSQFLFHKNKNRKKEKWRLP